MNHQDIRRRLSASIDGELPASEREIVVAHLKGCEACRREEQILRNLSAGIAESADYRLPEGFASAVVRSLRQEKERGAAWRPVEQWERRFVLALSVAVIVFITAGSLIQPGNPVVMETYLAGEPADSLTTRALLTEEQFSKDEILLAAVIR